MEDLKKYQTAIKTLGTLENRECVQTLWHAQFGQTSRLVFTY